MLELRFIRTCSNIKGVESFSKKIYHAVIDRERLQDEADVNAYMLWQARQVLATGVIVDGKLRTPLTRVGAIAVTAREKALHQRQVEL